jgi:hypothetical protein
MTAYMRIALGIVAGATLLGCATTADNAKPKPAATAATANDPTCLTETGSRVASGTSKCRGYGRAYSSGDIDRTGQTSAADALALMDPSVTVHR